MIGIILGVLGFVALVLAVVSVVQYTMAKESSSLNEKEKSAGYLIKSVLLLIIAIVLIGGTALITVVPAGSVGVQNTFGVVDDNVLQPGIHIKGPFTDVIMFSVRTQKYMDYGTNDKATITALSQDGLSTTMGIAVNYHVNPAKAAELYKQVGSEYESVIMVNPIHSVPRDLISKYDTKTLYSASQESSTDRAKIENELFDGISKNINTIGVKDSIVIEQVSLREVDFPQVYKDSIANKMTMDTQIAQKELEVRKQEMEAKRLVVEAQGEAAANIERARGEAEANRIRTESLNELLLRYTWIKSMETNPKAVYIPLGDNSEPMLNLVKSVD